jgi:hypothetical protein
VVKGIFLGASLSRQYISVTCQKTTPVFNIMTQMTIILHYTALKTSKFLLLFVVFMLACHPHIRHVYSHPSPFYTEIHQHNYIFLFSSMRIKMYRTNMFTVYIMRFFPNVVPRFKDMTVNTSDNKISHF